MKFNRSLALVLSTAAILAASLGGISAATAATPKPTPTPTPTPTVAPIPQVTGVSATWATQEGFVVDWQTPATAAAAKVTGYVVTASTGATCNVSGISTTECVFSNSVVPFGFKPYVRYTFTVAAKSATATGPVSAASNPAGWFGAPGYPGFITMKTISDNEIDLKWIPSASTGGISLTGYKVYYWPLSDDHAQKMVTTTTNSVSITGLVKSSWYVFTIASCNYYGCSNSDWAFQATTPAAASTSRSLLPNMINGGNASTTCWDAVLDGGKSSSTSATYTKALSACPAAAAPTTWPAVDASATTSPNLPIATLFNAKSRFSIASTSYSMAYKWNDNNLDAGAFSYSRSLATKVFVSNTPNVCSVIQKNGSSNAHYLAPGVCSITMTIPADATYAATAPITSSFTVRP